MGANSCDYFVFTPGAFDWETFPKFIVGNVAYDQAILGYARRAGLAMIEATDMIHAFHQTDEDGNAAGGVPGREGAQGRTPKAPLRVPLQGRLQRSTTLKL